MYGNVKAYWTASRNTPESRAFGDAEAHGWIDQRWSMTELFENRNDVQPALNVNVNDPELPELIRDELELLGAYSDNGDGTFYAQDCREELESEYDYSYALHFSLKTRDESGEWIERDFHPDELHSDYPHENGRLYGCTACESTCYCTPGQGTTKCVHCALEADALYY